METDLVEKWKHLLGDVPEEKRKMVARMLENQNAPLTAEPGYDPILEAFKKMLKEKKMMGKTKRILVIGDSCIDVFVYGHSTRLCPDRPVPIFVADREVRSAGMALNVYNNVKALLPSSSFITNPELVTKTRYIEEKHNHMFLRADSGEENIKVLTSNHTATVNWYLYDAVIISDYNKGFLTTEMIREIATSHLHVFLDTKKLLEPWYKEIPFIKINEHEFERSKHLITTTDNLIITQGSKGCTFRGKNYPVPKVNVVDTCGAGDTFIAALACKFVETQDIEQAIRFANICATDAVQRRGIYVIGEYDLSTGK